MGLGAQSFGYQYLAYNSGAATKTLKNYFTKIEKGEFPIQDIYPLPVSEAISKMISVAFYFAFLDLNNFKKRFNIDFLEYFKEEVEFLTNQGFIEIKDGMMIVTEKGVENVGGVIPMFYTKESREELMNMTGMF